VHELGRFMLQRGDAARIAIVNSPLSNFPADQSNEGKKRRQLCHPKNRLRV
jgi:hypothetical protein